MSAESPTAALDAAAQIPAVMNPREIVLISSVLPAPTSAGEIILHRHLSQAQDWNVSVIADRRRGSELSLPTRVVKRLYRTRFRRWAGSLDVLAHGRRWDILLPSRADGNHRTVVLTVAHGDGCWAARRFARKHSLPLATIFHDWWPDIPEVHAPCRRVLDRRFRQLYRDSDLALCVSDGMRHALGRHANSRVLYPLPSSLPSGFRLNAENRSSQLQVLYSGNLYDYGDMLGALLAHVQDHPTVRLQVRGPNPNWPADFQAEMRGRGLWFDFVPRAEFIQWLNSADAFLVVMSFDARLRRRMETSFPSKLTEFAQVGRPLVIWGPEYCSAVQWARGGDRAYCVTDERPAALVAALAALQRSPQRCAHYGVAALEAATREFDPALLQREFVDALAELTHAAAQARLAHGQAGRN
jgi:glycosyltransferase involved in cell wall biosynthesis